MNLSLLKMRFMSFYCARKSHLPSPAVYTPGHLFDLSLTNLVGPIWACSELTNYEPSLYHPGYARQTLGDTFVSWPWTPPQTSKYPIPQWNSLPGQCCKSMWYLLGAWILVLHFIATSQTELTNGHMTTSQTQIPKHPPSQMWVHMNVWCHQATNGHRLMTNKLTRHKTNM